MFVGHGVGEFFRESLKLARATISRGHAPVPEWIVVPTVMMAVGFVVAWQFYIRRPAAGRAARQHQPLYQFLLNKWYFDEIYDFLIVRPTLWLGRPL